MSPTRTLRADLTGAQLEAWLARHGLGVRALARALGLSHSTILTWTAGRTPIPRWVPLALAELARQARRRARPPA